MREIRKADVKRLIALLLCVFTVVSVMPMSALLVMADEGETASGNECGPNATWVIDDMGILTVSGEGEVTSAPWKDIGNRINKVVIEEGITGICKSAFENCIHLNSVAIPGTMEVIPESAFKNCTNLNPSAFSNGVYIGNELVLPENIKEIGEGAFEGCTALWGVSGVGVEVIGNFAFKGCDMLHNVKFTNAKTVGDYAFKDCRGLNNLGVGESCTSIGAFAYENALNSGILSIPASITQIGEGAFKNCTTLQLIFFDSQVTEIAPSTFENCTSLSCFFASNVKIENVGEKAFFGCSALTTPLISDAIKTIGDSAYEGCAALGETEMFNSITAIGENAFKDCTSLVFKCNSGSYAESYAIEHNIPYKANVSTIATGSCGSNATWTLDSRGVLTILGEGAISGATETGIHTASWKDYIGDIKTVIIGEGISNIRPYTFRDCVNMTDVTIPDTVNVIGVAAFYGCSSLKSVVIPDMVDAIPDSTFYTCSSLESVTIGSGVTRIGPWAFYKCYALESIDIPDSVATIGDSAFVDNSSLIKVNIGKGLCNIGNNAFGGCKALQEINVDEENQYYFGQFGVLFNKDMTELLIYPCSNSNINYVVPDSVTAIADYAFYDADLITSVVIPDSVITIGTYAFCSCSALEEITFGKGIEKIGETAFYECYNADKVYISDLALWCQIEFACWDSNPLNYAGKIYLNKELVLDLVIPEGVTDIGDYAFRGGFGFKTITLPAGLKTIGAHSFFGCSNITSIVIPEGVTVIGEWAFQNCFDLTEVTIPDTVTVIEDQAFDNCQALKSVNIPASVESIGQDAFFGCKSLTEISVDPDNMYYTSETGILFNKEKTLLIVMPEAFEISEYIIPDTVTELADYSVNCTKLEKLIIPNSVTTIGRGTFRNADALRTLTIPESVTSIGLNAFAYCDDITLRCYPGSYAESYAIKYNIPYESIIPRVSSEGVVMTVHHLDGAKDFLIAKGDYNTYREVKNNLVALVTNAKFGETNEYTYWLSDYGVYTVYIRYTDTEKEPVILKTEITGIVPELLADGLRLTVKNLEGVKVIRTAYGDYSKAGDIKRAEGQRSVSASRITGDEYTFQYRENGLVTVAVVYENGYTHLFKHEIKKYTPNFIQEGNTVTISELDNLKVIRYAKGEYSTSSQIKNAPGCVNITPSRIKDGKVTLTLEKGVYSFCVQYNDESYNYYTVTVE